MLQLLNGRADVGDGHHIVRMRDFFVFRAHLCLVFELLSVNLYELIKHNQFRGLSMNLLRLFMTQVAAVPITSVHAACLLRVLRFLPTAGVRAKLLMLLTHCCNHITAQGWALLLDH